MNFKIKKWVLAAAALATVVPSLAEDVTTSVPDARLFTTAPRRGSRFLQQVVASPPPGPALRGAPRVLVTPNPEAPDNPYPSVADTPPDLTRYQWWHDTLGVWDAHNKDIKGKGALIAIVGSGAFIDHAWPIIRGRVRTDLCTSFVKPFNYCNTELPQMGEWDAPIASIGLVNDIPTEAVGFTNFSSSSNPTELASVAAAGEIVVNNQTVGTVGVAPEASVVFVKAFSHLLGTPGVQRGYTRWTIQAIRYAADIGADVIVTSGSDYLFNTTTREFPGLSGLKFNESMLASFTQDYEDAAAYARSKGAIVLTTSTRGYKLDPEKLTADQRLIVPQGLPGYHVVTGYGPLWYATQFVNPNKTAVPSIDKGSLYNIAAGFSWGTDNDGSNHVAFAGPSGYDVAGDENVRGNATNPITSPCVFTARYIADAPTTIPNCVTTSARELVCNFRCESYDRVGGGGWASPPFPTPTNVNYPLFRNFNALGGSGSLAGVFSSAPMAYVAGVAALIISRFQSQDAAAPFARRNGRTAERADRLLAALRKVSRDIEGAYGPVRYGAGIPTARLVTRLKWNKEKQEWELLPN